MRVAFQSRDNCRAMLNARGEESLLLYKLRITTHRITKFLTRNRSHYVARYTGIVITLHTLTCSSEYIMLAICPFHRAETAWKCPSLCTCILREIQFGLAISRFSYIFMGAFGSKDCDSRGICRWIYRCISISPWTIRSHLTFRSSDVKKETRK